jgi:alpha-tubulin suppressor-like RCC1 family protein
MGARLLCWSLFPLLGFAAACHGRGSSTATDAAAPSASAAASSPGALSPSGSAAAAEPPGQAVEIAMGLEHGCARLRDGTVRCWGDNLYGQLGIPGIGKHPPTAVPGLGPVAQIAASAESTCARRDDGKVLCWGKPLGASDAPDAGLPAEPFIPRPVAGLDRPATQIAMSASGRHACARLDDATVRCWGDNSCGQLGDGTTRSRTRAAPVARLFSRAQLVAAGVEHSCALTDDGVFCWGDARWFGEEDARLRRAPDLVPVLADAKTLALGPFHTCIVRKDGIAACVGKDQGQLCDVKPIKKGSAFVPAMTGVTDLAVAQDHAAAIRTDGSLVLWGEAVHFGGAPGDCKAPTAAADSVGVAQVVVGESHDLALRRDGRVVYWDLGKKPALVRGLE